MKSSLSSDKISYEELQLHTRLYDQYLPPKIEGLEKLRLEEFLKFSRQDEHLEMSFLKRPKSKH